MGRPKFRMKVYVSCLLVLLLVTSITVRVAWAANPHYKQGGKPTCSPSSASVTGTTFAGSCTDGLAAGLGNEDLRFGVIATVSAGTFCHNRGNPANIVPGQNPGTAQFANLQTIPGSAIKNGNATLPGFSLVSRWVLRHQSKLVARMTKIGP
jgi:hypothetical protein